MRSRRKSRVRSVSRKPRVKSRVKARQNSSKLTAKLRKSRVKSRVNSKRLKARVRSKSRKSYKGGKKTQRKTKKRSVNKRRKINSGINIIGGAGPQNPTSSDKKLSSEVKNLFKSLFECNQDVKVQLENGKDISMSEGKRKEEALNVTLNSENREIAIELRSTDDKNKIFWVYLQDGEGYKDLKKKLENGQIRWKGEIENYTVTVHIDHTDKIKTVVQESSSPSEDNDPPHNFEYKKYRDFQKAQADKAKIRDTPSRTTTAAAATEALPAAAPASPVPSVAVSKTTLDDGGFGDFESASTDSSESFDFGEFESAPTDSSKDFDLLTPPAKTPERSPAASLGHRLTDGPVGQAALPNLIPVLRSTARKPLPRDQWVANQNAAKESLQLAARTTANPSAAKRSLQPDNNPFAETAALGKQWLKKKKNSAPSPPKGEGPN